MAKKDELIEQLADKYHVDKKEVEKAVNSQFRFVSKSMAQEDMPSIRLPFFGIFKADRRRIKHLTKARQINERRKD